MKSLGDIYGLNETNHIHLTIGHELDTRSTPILNLHRSRVSSSNGLSFILPSFYISLNSRHPLHFHPHPLLPHTQSLKTLKNPFLILFNFSIMLLRAPSAAISVANSRGENLVPLFSASSSSSSSILRLSPVRNGGGLIVSASKGANTRPLTGVVFEPFEEVKKELSLIPTAPQVSLARQKYSDACEAAINEQIK